MNTNTFQEFYEKYVTPSIPLNPKYTEQFETNEKIKEYNIELEALKAKEPQLDNYLLKKDTWEGSIPLVPPEPPSTTLGEPSLIILPEPDRNDSKYQITTTTEIYEITNKIADLNLTDNINGIREKSSGESDGDYHKYINNEYVKLIQTAKTLEQALAPYIQYMDAHIKDSFYVSAFAFLSEDGPGGKPQRYSLIMNYQLSDQLSAENTTNVSLTQTGIGITDEDKNFIDSISHDYSKKEAIKNLYFQAVIPKCK